MTAAKLPDWAEEWAPGVTCCGEPAVRVQAYNGTWHTACSLSGWGVEHCPDRAAGSAATPPQAGHTWPRPTTPRAEYAPDGRCTCGGHRGDGSDHGIFYCGGAPLEARAMSPFCDRCGDEAETRGQVTAPAYRAMVCLPCLRSFAAWLNAPRATGGTP